MPRSRNIKHSFFTNDSLGSLKPLARLLFAGLWCIADSEGRLENRPKKIKIEVLPYDNCCIEQLLEDLHKEHFIEIYEVENSSYIQIVNFRKHQNPHKNEKASSIPPPVISRINHEMSRGTRVIDGTAPADSCILIPDSCSLIPEGKANAFLLCGKPHAKSRLREDAKEVLEYLNKVTNQNFQPTVTNLNFIMGRLKETGVTVQTCRTIIANKYGEWKDELKSRKWLRPKTLFNRTNFDQYLGQLPKLEDLEHE